MYDILGLLLYWQFPLLFASLTLLLVIFRAFKKVQGALHTIATRRQTGEYRALQRPGNLAYKMWFLNIQVLTVRVVSCLRESYLETPPIERWHFTDSSLLSPPLRGSCLSVHICRSPLMWVWIAFLSIKKYIF